MTPDEFDEADLPTPAAGEADPFGIRATAGQLTSLDTPDPADIRRRGDRRRRRKLVGGVAGVAAVAVLAGAGVLAIGTQRGNDRPDIAVPPSASPSTTSSPTPSQTPTPSRSTSATPTPSASGSPQPTATPTASDSPGPSESVTPSVGPSSANAALPTDANLPRAGELYMFTKGDSTLDERRSARDAYLDCRTGSDKSLPKTAFNRAVVYNAVPPSETTMMNVRVYGWADGTTARSVFDQQRSILSACSSDPTYADQKVISQAAIPVKTPGVTAYNVTVQRWVETGSNLANISDYLLLTTGNRYMLVDLTSGGHQDWNCSATPGGVVDQCSLPAQADVLATILKR